MINEELVVENINGIEVERAKLNSMMMLFEIDSGMSSNNDDLLNIWQKCLQVAYTICFGKGSCEELIIALNNNFNYITSKMNERRKALCKRSLSVLISKYEDVKESMYNLCSAKNRIMAIESIRSQDGRVVSMLRQTVEEINLLLYRLKKITGTEYVNFPVVFNKEFAYSFR